jgi:Icc protein
MIIAQISDLHARPPGRLAYGLDTNALGEAAVAALLALDPAPDCVLVTGDLTDCGSSEAYALVAAMLRRLPMPVFVIPGNHDEREAFRAGLRPHFPHLPRTGFLHYVVDDFPVRLIGLDTVVPGQHGGVMCPKREAWLRARLEARPARPTIIFMHHPPFLTGIHGMDELICRVSENFAPLIAAHPEIERIVCGHYHRPIQLRYAGTVGYVAPGTAHQVALDLRPGRANRLVLEPPGFALHVLHQDVGIVSHTCPIGDFGASRSFEAEPADA